MTPDTRNFTGGSRCTGTQRETGAPSTGNPGGHESPVKTPGHTNVYEGGGVSGPKTFADYAETLRALGKTIEKKDARIQELEEDREAAQDARIGAEARIQELEDHLVRLDGEHCGGCRDVFDCWGIAARLDGKG